MSARQFFFMLRARWLLVLTLFLLSIGSAAAISLLLPKQYTASAAVVIDVKTPDPIAGALSPAVAMPSFMATQVDILESDRVALQVVRALKLTDSPDMIDKWNADTKATGNFELWLANRLQRSLEVKPSKESNLVTVNFTSVSPRFSVAVANAFVKAYIETMVDLRVDPAKQYSTFFDTRSRQLRDDVGKAQAKLSAFQRQQGMLVTDERLDVETLRLSELSAQLVALQGSSADSRSRQVAATTTPDQLQDVITNPVVAGLRTDLSRAEAKLQEMSERFGDSHPSVVEARANISGLQSKLLQETQRLSGSVGVTNIINQSREFQVRSSLEAQRAKLLKMKTNRDESAVLQREVENAQRAYDGVMARLTQMSLESQVNQTNASVLMWAVEPSRHSAPQLSFNLAIGAFVGVLLAIAGALLRESTDRRIRTLEDVAHEVGLPVLGTLIGRAPKGWFGRPKPHLIPSDVLRRSSRAINLKPAKHSA